MTIYHVGVEDIHFIQGGANTATSTITTFRPGWARCCLGSGGGRFWRAPLEHMAVSVTEFWWTCRVFLASSVISFRDWIHFLDGPNWRLALAGRETELPELWLHTNEPNPFPFGQQDPHIVLAIGTFPLFAAGKIGKVDIYCNLADGIFRLYLDRTLSIDFTGDLTGGLFGNITGFDLWGGLFQGSALFSEVCWRSDDTRKIVGLQTIYPVDNGVNMQWTGIKEDVDEIIVDEADANYTGTTGLIQEYKVVAPPINTTQNTIVSAVMVGARMATGPTDEAVVVRTGGADYQSSSFSTGGAIQDRMNIWEQNPATSSDFTLDEILDDDFNIGVAST